MAAMEDQSNGRREGLEATTRACYADAKVGAFLVAGSEASMAGMNSKSLSARLRQPGHDSTFRLAEANFVAVATRVIEAHFPGAFVITAQGSELADIFGHNPETGRPLGIRPEATITHLETGRSLFFEVKKQGPAGNAEERACKHHTLRFARLLNERFGWNYHPFVTVFCDSLATEARYTLKFASLFERDNYLLWVDYDARLLEDYLVGRVTDWILQGG